MLKFQDVKAQLRAFQMTVTYNPNTQEFRVNFIHGQNETAYFTTDLQDALDTGIAMRRSGMVFEDSERYDNFNQP